MQDTGAISEAAAVVVLRADAIESRHRVAYAVVDPSGRLLHGRDDLGLTIFPRSALKPFQALALVESGAAEHFDVTDPELALACGSHGGEPIHVEAVLGWLARLGLDRGALDCGAHPPLDADAAARLAATGARPGPAHNNCSGKHAGMLTLARHMGAPVRGYADPAHPVQLRIAEVLTKMAGSGPLLPPAIDGCGVPTWRLPLIGLATAAARLGAPDDLPPPRAEACRRVAAAMMCHPEMVAGTGRACTRIMTSVPGLVVKIGAEGVYLAALPERGLGLALKVEDGAARAAPVALLALLDLLGTLDDRSRAALADVARPVLRNHAGTPVGAIRVADGWAQPWGGPASR